MATTFRRMRYGYYISDWIFKNGELGKVAIWHSYVNCTTVNRRLNRHAYWIKRIMEEETLPERMIELLEFSAHRAFRKVTCSERYKSRKNRTVCRCYLCVAKDRGCAGQPINHHRDL